MAISEQALNNLIGEIVAPNISLDDYMEHYAEQHCEWVEGVVIKMAATTLKYDDLRYYLRQFFTAYFELRPIGRVKSEPFVMRLPSFPNRRREPDLMIILKTNPHELKKTYLDGPADICIEIVSEESVERDHGDKFREYEQGSVPEYWIVDPLHYESRFYRLNDEGSYVRQNEDAEGNYRTSLLPGLVLNVPALWQDDLPGPAATARAINELLED